MIDDALYYGILIIGAVIEVAFFTLASLFAYKWISKRRIIKSQAGWVFISLLIFNSAFGIYSYFIDDIRPVSEWLLSTYLLAVFGMGILVAHITAMDKV